MKKYFSMTDIYNDLSKVAVTAHRGASYSCPENTIPAMEQAIAGGADFIEFDLRMTSDGIPVVIHDDTIDRTSDGTGRLKDHTLSELKEYNFSWFVRDARQKKPVFERLEIPSFEDILKAFRHRVFMNIQIYTENVEDLDAICALYQQYEMYDLAYLTIADWDIAKRVRKTDPRIDICMTPGWHERILPENLRRCHEFGCRFVQPIWDSLNAGTIKLCRELGLYENIFYADTPEGFKRLLDLGVRGIMTNRPEELRLFL